MLVYTIINIISIFFSILLCYFVIANKTGKTKESALFLGVAFTFIFWVVSSNIGNSLQVNHEVALIFNRIALLSSFILVALALRFILLLANHSRIMPEGVVPFLLSLLSILFISPLLVENVYAEGSVYGIEFGPLGWFYALTMSFLVISVIWIIVTNWQNSNKLVRKNIRVVGGSIAVGAPIMLILGLILPSTTGFYDTTKFTEIPALLILVALYYATIKHGLFDLRAVAVRTMAYVLTLSALTAVYFILAYFLSMVVFGGQISSGLSISPLNVLLALIMAIIFQPIKNLFDKLTNDIFYRETYDPEQFLKEFSRILSYNTNINLLINRASEYITRTLKASSVDFYIIGRKPLNIKNKNSLRLSENAIKTIIDLVPNNREEIIQTDNLDQGLFKKILSHNKIKIIIPMRLNNQSIGYMLLGEKRTGDYDLRDIRMLGSIISELVIAISNSLSVEVIRDLNENLQQKVDNATRELRRSNEKLKELDKTKDEFLSIASHQLRTPLTSIKGYVDMLRDGDFGEVNEAQKNALDETFFSSERMVRLINDFLNISRLQTGKFTIEKRPTSFDDLVQQEVNMLKLVAAQSDIKINAKIDKINDVNLDVEKVQQVVVNMIDNAIYYSKPNSTIEVKLKKSKNFAEFTVKDTGIGVPKEDQEKLFSKFFRAPNARTRRPDGTGVGLFLSKKVVVGHKGEIIFKSEEGKGSTFGFKLPL